MKNQVSGSLTFDVSGLAVAVTETLEPTLRAIGENLSALATAANLVQLDENEALAVVTGTLPAGLRCEQMRDGGDPAEVARFLLEHLARQGYVLTAVRPQQAATWFPEH